MNSIPKEQQPDLIAAARIARAGEPDPWTQIAEYFDKQRRQAEEVIEPRDTRRETPNK